MREKYELFSRLHWKVSTKQKNCANSCNHLVIKQMKKILSLQFCVIVVIQWNYTWLIYLVGKCCHLEVICIRGRGRREKKKNRKRKKNLTLVTSRECPESGSEPWVVHFSGDKCFNRCTTGCPTETSSLLQSTISLHFLSTDASEYGNETSWRHWIQEP